MLPAPMKLGKKPFKSQNILHMYVVLPQQC